jgi:DNA-directed RNA polymerase II subunit RPB1
MFILITIMTRLLTETEINDILDFIKVSPYIPAETSISVNNNIKNKLRAQLVTQKVYPSIIPKLKTMIQNAYDSTLIQAGESVGVICAQSIGEKQTQSTLNTFHQAGASEKTVTQGVPRFQELINATKNPRTVNNKIYLCDNNNSTIEETRKIVGSAIVGISLNDIATKISVVLNKAYEKWYEPFKIIYNDNFVNYAHCISVKLNKQKLFEYQISLESICKFIENQYDDLFCVFSPLGDAQIDIFVDTSNIELPEERISFINTNNVEEIYLEECVQPILEKINMFGVEGIKEIFYVQENNEWLIETNGINSRTISTQYNNYKKLLAIDIIDATRTISNNVWDIYEVLGVEAAREFLIQEFMSIMEGINSCHACLLVDRMTFNGNIASITRYTMKKDDSGPFGKASFEETMDNFLNAAVNGEIEPTKGVSASIICGKRANIGTGLIDVKLDLSLLPSCMEE